MMQTLSIIQKIVYSEDKFPIPQVLNVDKRNLQRQRLNYLLLRQTRELKFI